MVTAILFFGAFFILVVLQAVANNQRNKYLFKKYSRDHGSGLKFSGIKTEIFVVNKKFSVVADLYIDETGILLRSGQWLIMPLFLFQFKRDNFKRKARTYTIKSYYIRQHEIEIVLNTTSSLGESGFIRVMGLNENQKDQLINYLEKGLALSVEGAHYATH